MSNPGVIHRPLALSIMLFLPSLCFAQAFSKTEVIEYYDDTSIWALGQQSKVICANSVPASAGCTGGSDSVVSETEYGWAAMPVRIKDFGRITKELTYNPGASVESGQRGMVASSSDGRGNTTTFANWKRGTPQLVKHADGTKSSAIVSDFGQIIAATDQNGFVTGYSYDSMGRLSGVTYPEGDTVAWNSLTRSLAQISAPEMGIPAGHWRLTVKTGNASKAIYFDGLWRPLIIHEYDSSSAASTQRFTGFEYDYLGRIVFSSYPSASSSSDKGVWTSYDALGRVSSVSRDSEAGLLRTSTFYARDSGGPSTTVRNPKGYEVKAWYQMYDEPVYKSPIRLIQPEGAVTVISRDAFGKPTKIQREGALGQASIVRTYGYDSQQLLCKSVEPESGVTLYGYDKSGNLAWSAGGLPSSESCATGVNSQVVSDRMVRRSYDQRNQLHSITFPDGNGNQVWTYTPDGKPSSVTTSDTASGTQAVNSYSYNKRRLLISESVSQMGGYMWNVGFAYDANGSLAGMKYPSGMYIDYSPNALGQPTMAGQFAGSITYHPNGGMASFKYGNGIVRTIQQNSRQLPSQIIDVGTMINSYEYDAQGNVTKISDGKRTQRSRSMNYDGLDRLTKAISQDFGGSGEASYTYDSQDNITQISLPGVRTHRYWYDQSNRLSNVADESGATIVGLTYDPQGNLSTRNGQQFVFDFGNRLRAVPGRETYRYDGAGRRVVSWSPDGGNIISMYDSKGVLRRQDDSRRSRSAEYIYLNGSLVASIVNSTKPEVPLKPDQPNGLKIGGVNLDWDNGIMISWSAVPRATYYEIREVFSMSTGEVKIHNVGPSLNKTWNVNREGFSFGDFFVRACNDVGCSEWAAAHYGT